MTELKNAWWKMMTRKHGSEEAVREYMRQQQLKGVEKRKQQTNYGGGFNSMSKEEVQAASRKGLASRTNKAQKDVRVE